MDAEEIPPEPSAINAPEARLPEFLSLVSQATITTDLLLVSFIPDRIKLDAFTQLMGSITSSLVSSSARQHGRIPVYKRPGFEEFFLTKPPLWMVMFHAAEQHGSFLLQLPISLTFAIVGGPNGLQPPRFFTAPLNKRTCVVQAVPPDFKEVLLHSPELAFWRGLGADLSSGHHIVLAAAIEAHTQKAFLSCVASGELPSSVRHFSFLA